MSFWDSLIIAVFGLGMVFVILVALSAIITVESKLFSLIKFSKKTEAVTKDSKEPVSEAPFDTGATAGELKLIGVDERTAAMIMAIVSDESKIPLSELQFKSIKAVD